MPISVGGLEYEKKVRDAVEVASKKNKNIQLLPDATAGFNANEVDLKIRIAGKTHNIEIKSSPDDQMGGTSLQFAAYPTLKISPVLKSGQPTLDYDTYSIIIEAYKDTGNALRAFVDFFKTQAPIALHDKVNGFPMSVSKDAWELATSKGLLKPLNKKAKLDTSFIANHYKKKNCYYIQIGDAGLFYMHSNPLNLPVPKLLGEIDVEIRAARSGSKLNSTYKMETVGGGIRAQARLKTKSTSPYSLDNPDHVLILFGK
jgi:hypothetical protein